MVATAQAEEAAAETDYSEAGETGEKTLEEGKEPSRGARPGIFRKQQPHAGAWGDT